MSDRDHVAAAVERFFTGRKLGPSPGLVAVSGGADSVALLLALTEAKTGPLTVVHVNHQLRGVESEGDETFVRELAHRLSWGCRVLHTDTQRRAAETRESLETAARRMRYDWFVQMAHETGSAWIATAHTADDQAETVLHRLVRGTGLTGLRGIPAVRTVTPRHDAVHIIRPFLTLPRRDLLAFLATHHQHFRTDSSNVEARFTRNRIRHEVLPLLASFNPDVVAALGSLAGQAVEACELLAPLPRQLLDRAERPRAGAWCVLDAETLLTASPFVMRELFRLVWERESWPMGRMTANHWHRLGGVAHGDPPAADFPDGVTAMRVGRVVQLGRRA